MAGIVEKCVLHRDAWSIRAAVTRILDGEVLLAEKVWPHTERRTCARAALQQQRMGLFTPAVVGQSSIATSAERPMLVAALDISPKGIRLTHDFWLSKQGVVWFNGSKDGPVHLVVEHRWTQVREHYGDRMSGFAIVGVADWLVSGN